MNALLSLRRIAANLLALCGLIIVLAACTLASRENFTTADEAVTPLPASFAFFGYADRPGGFVRTEEAGEILKLEGKGYVSADNSMSVYFVPLAGNTYLLAATAAEGTIYGIAKLYDTGVVEVRVAFDAGLEEALAAAAAPAAIAAALKVTDGSIEVTSREALDFVIALIVGDKLPTAQLIGYVGATPDSPTPASINRDGDGWKVTN